MTEMVSGDLVDEQPVDELVPNMRQIMPAPALLELIAEVEHVLAGVQATGAEVDRQAVVVAHFFAPRLAELRADAEDARFELNKALHAAVTEPGVPVESEIRRALRTHGVTEDRLLDACVVAVRRTLPSLASELADGLATQQERLEQVDAELARQVDEVQYFAGLARRRHEVAQRLREELQAALVDADRFRALASGACPRGLHAGGQVTSGHHLYVCPCLLGELIDKVDAGEMDEATRVADLNDLDQHAPTEDEIAAMEYAAECADQEPMSAYEMDPDIDEPADERADEATDEFDLDGAR